MLLSLIIKHSTQILFPSGKLIRLIEPVLSKHRQNIKFYNRTHPLISAAGFLSSAEIAVSNLESASKRFIICYLFIQCLDLVDQRIEGFVRKIYAATAKASEGGKNVYGFLLSGKDTKEGAMEEKSIDEVLKGGYTEILGVNAYTGGYSWAILKDGEFYAPSYTVKSRPSKGQSPMKVLSLPSLPVIVRDSGDLPDAPVEGKTVILAASDGISGLDEGISSGTYALYNGAAYAAV